MKVMEGTASLFSSVMCQGSAVLECDFLQKEGLSSLLLLEKQESSLKEIYQSYCICSD